MSDKKSLQELFIESKGQPVQIGPDTVIQMDEIPIRADSVVTLTFVRAATINNAVVFALPRGVKVGGIGVSDGSTKRLVNIWDGLDAHRIRTLKVSAGSERLQIFNRYRTHHRSGLVTEDYSTGNAGMVVTTIGSAKRHYECSTGPGPFSKDFVFEIEWSSSPA